MVKVAKVTASELGNQRLVGTSNVPHSAFTDPANVADPSSSNETSSPFREDSGGRSSSDIGMLANAKTSAAATPLPSPTKKRTGDYFINFVAAGVADRRAATILNS